MAGMRRAILFFSDDRYGFTEAHHFVGRPDLTTFKDRSLLLAGVRADLLGLGANLDWIRLSLDDEATDAFLVGPLVPRPPIVRPLLAEVPWSAVLLQVESRTAGASYRTPIYLAGVPDDLIIAGPVIARIAAWNRSFEAYRNELISGPWGVRILSRDINTAPCYRVQGASVAGGICTLIVRGHPFARDDEVHVSSLRSRSGRAPAGDYPVLAVPDEDSIIIGPVDDNWRYRSAGRVRRSLYEIAKITDVNVRGMRQRNRGNKFHPVSWEILDEDNWPLNTCGQIVDLLKSCYTARMRFIQGSDKSSLIRWYEAEPGALIAPYTIFASSVWHDQRSRFSSLGESPLGHRWARCSTCGGPRGTCHLGTDKQWAEGLTLPESLFRPPTPECCMPAFQGLLIRDPTGTPSFDATCIIDVDETGILRIKYVNKHEVLLYDDKTHLPGIFLLTKVCGIYEEDGQPDLSAYPPGAFPVADHSGAIGPLLPGAEGSILTMHGGLPTWSLGFDGGTF